MVSICIPFLFIGLMSSSGTSGIISISGTPVSYAEAARAALSASALSFSPHLSRAKLHQRSTFLLPPNTSGSIFSGTPCAYLSAARPESSIQCSKRRERHHRHEIWASAIPPSQHQLRNFEDLPTATAAASASAVHPTPYIPLGDKTKIKSASADCLPHRAGTEIVKTVP